MIRRVAAPLAAALAALAFWGCNGDGAEPGAPQGATLVLDFEPNAAHAGIYTARLRGHFEDEGVDLEILEPTSTAGGVRLLDSGRADFAVMDINDFGIARQLGLDIVAIGAIVQRPLAAVIAVAPERIRTPADLAGSTIGVTGVPSDDAVLDTILAEGGVAPGEVERRTIGFQSVALLAAGKVDAATAFWNAEGVELRQQGLPTRVFRVDRFGAPRYPELVLAVRRSIAQEGDTDGIACRVLRALELGYRVFGERPSGDPDPNIALKGLFREVPGIDPDSQRAQLAALTAANAFSNAGEEDATIALNESEVIPWRRWGAARGVLEGAPGATVDIEAEGFRPRLLSACRRPGDA